MVTFIHDLDSTFYIFSKFHLLTKNQRDKSFINTWVLQLEGISYYKTLSLAVLKVFLHL